MYGTYGTNGSSGDQSSNRSIKQSIIHYVPYIKFLIRVPFFYLPSKKMGGVVFFYASDFILCRNLFFCIYVKTNPNLPLKKIN